MPEATALLDQPMLTVALLTILAAPYPVYLWLLSLCLRRMRGAWRRWTLAQFGCLLVIAGRYLWLHGDLALPVGNALWLAVHTAIATLVMYTFYSMHDARQRDLEMVDGSRRQD